MTLRHRVQVETPTGALLYYAAEDEARHLLVFRRAIAQGHKGGAVCIIRLVEHQIPARLADMRDVRSGSYGAVRDNLSDGHRCYRHAGLKTNGRINAEKFGVGLSA